MPFFPRILVHLVRLDDGVIQRVAVEPPPRVSLEAVPQSQQVLAVAAQLTGHVGSGFTRGDTVEDQHDLTRAAVCPLEDGPGPGIEHAAAVPTLILQDRLAMAAVDTEALLLSTPRTSQPAGVE
jgi:hypothetical protein